MRFLVVSQPSKASIYGEDYVLRPLEPVHFEPENILVADDGSASELLGRHPSILREALFETKSLPGFPVQPENVEQIRPGSKVLILKAGGVGDHVMFLPALRALRKAVGPDVRLTLATQKEKHLLFSGQKALDDLLPLPVRLDQILGVDFIVDYSGSLHDTAFNSMNMTDYFIQGMNLNPQGYREKSPRMHLQQGGYGEIENRLRQIRQVKPRDPLVILEWKSSVWLRDFPHERLLRLAEIFPDIQFVTAKALSERSLVGTHRPNVTDMSPLINGLADYVALFRFCDGVVSTDTAAYHLAEGFEKPSLVLFGSISAPLRIGYYTKARSVQSDYVGNTCSAPCGLHKSNNGCPESGLLKTPYVPCLLHIEEGLIVRAFEEMCNKYFSH